MLTTEAVSQFRPRLSLRGRLYLFSGALLILFAINVGTSLWGSFARNESLIAYQEAVTAAQLTAELEQNLQNKRQQVLVLAICLTFAQGRSEHSPVDSANAPFWLGRSRSVPMCCCWMNPSTALTCALKS